MTAWLIAVAILAAPTAWLAWCELRPNPGTRAAPRRHGFAWKEVTPSAPELAIRHSSRARTRVWDGLRVTARRGQPRKNGSQGAGLIVRRVGHWLPSPRTTAPAPGVTIPPSNVRLIPATAHEDPLPVAALPPAQDDPGRLFTWQTGEFSRALLEDMLAGAR